MTRLLTVLLLGLLASCSTSPTARSLNWPDLDESERQRYADFLSAAGQEAFPASSRKTIVRISWLRSFHNPVFIRVDCGARCKLRSVRLSGAGVTEPGQIVESHDLRLPSETKDELLNLITRVQTDSNLPPRPPAAKTYMVDGQLVEEIVVHTDGSNWVVEIVDSRGFDVLNVAGWELEETESLAELCRFLVSASGVRIPDGEYY